MNQLNNVNMFSSYYILGFILAIVWCRVPHWQRQIPYNDIAHLYHSMYREMFIPFKETNRTAGNVILEKMEKVMEGVKELHHLTDVTPEQEFHKKYLMPVRFMILRGKKQWGMITYRDQELIEKYGWSESQLARFREIYREVVELVNEMEQFCAVRHIDLSDKSFNKHKMILSRNNFSAGITLVIGMCAALSTCQSILQKINSVSKSLVLDKTITDCIHKTVIKRNYQQSREFLKILSTSVNKLKYEVLEPMKTQKNYQHERDVNLLDTYTNLKSIINNLNSIQCKKKIKKKGVMKKIKKYMPTEEPRAKKEEKAILQSYEDFDGWTFEHLQLMKQYYEEIQQELAEIRKLCPS